MQSTGTAGVRFKDGSQQLVYLTFGLEAVAKSSKRADLTRRAMNWFGFERRRISGRVRLAGSNQGIEDIEVTLSGDSSATTRTDAEGRYSFGVTDGSYTVAPSASKFDFDPQSRSITVSGSNKTGLDFEATLANPALSLEGFNVRFEFPGNNDGTANPGEFLSVTLSMKNVTDSTIAGPYARMDRTFDKFVHPIDAYFFDGRVGAFLDLSPDTTAAFRDDFDFYIDGDTPDGHILEVPMRFFSSNDQLIGRDTLALPVRGTDTTPPSVDGFHTHIRPGFVKVGNPTTISAFVSEGSKKLSAEATITRRSDGKQVGTVALTDDGSGADREAGDRWFTGTFAPSQESEYVVDISATDDKGNTGGFEGATFTSVPFAKSGNVLVVSDNGRPWRDDFEPEYTGSVRGVGLTEDVWNVYQRGVPPVDTVSQYKATVWYTGFQFRPLGREERSVIDQHLSGGGKLLLSGERIAEDLSRDDATFLNETLRASFVQDRVDRFEVEGESGDPISDGFVAGLDRDAFGSEEIDPASGGTTALTYDDAVTEPKSAALAKGKKASRREQRRCGWRAESRRPGCEAGPGARRSGPSGPAGAKAARAGPTKAESKDIESSGTAGVRFDDGSQQLVYLAFGLEAVAESGKQSELTRRVMKWFGLERRSIAGRITTVGSDRGIQGITVTLSGDSSATVTTDETGRYNFFVSDGNYTVTPSASTYDFSPSDSTVTVDQSNKNATVNFEATLSDPALTLASSSVRFEFPGNGDGDAQAGEFLGMELSVENAADSTIKDAYARMDRSADGDVHPIGAYFFDDRVEASKDLSGQTTTVFRDNFDFHVAAGADGKTLEVPMAFFSGNDQLVGQDTLELSVKGSDTTDPFVGGFDVDIEPGFVPTGTPDTVSAFVTEASEQVTVEADVETPDETVVKTITLTDDGSGADEKAGDRRFTGTFTPQQEAEFFVDVSATDAVKNTGGFENATFTSVPFAKSGDVLLVSDNGRRWTDDFESEYLGALQANGFAPDVWRVYERGTPPVDTMSQYKATVWFTGRFRGVGRKAERTALADYLSQKGGKLLLAGREVAEDLHRRDRSWLEQNLHATFVQPRVDRFEAEGISGDPVSGGLTLPLDSDGYDSDEVDPTSGANQILKYDNSVTQPKSAVPDRSRSKFRHCGWQAKGRSAPDDCEPASGEKAGSAGSSQGSSATSSAKAVRSSGTAGLRFAGSDQRLVFLTFGLEAVSKTASRDQLVGNAIDWLTPGAGCPLSWSLDVTGSAGNSSQTITLGQSRNATAGQDAACGEDGLASGPSGFDLRFTGTDLTGVDLGTNGDTTDIRPNFKRTGTPKTKATSARATWRIDLQTSSGSGTVSLSWDHSSLQSALPDRRVRLVDVGTGGSNVDVDMKQTGSVDIDDSNVDAVHVRLDPPVTRSIPISSNEWDVLSVPVQAEPQTFAAVLGASSSGACRSGFFFDPDNGYKTIRDGQTLPVGRGGFFKCPRQSQTTVSVTGQTASPTVSVKPGWNIVGTFEDTVEVKNVSKNLLESGKFWAYEGTFVEADSLKPGLGYWVKATSAGTIDLSTTGKAGGPVASANRSSQVRAAADDSGVEDSGLKLVLTDRRGHRATVRLMETLSEEERAQYLIPPTPPANIFDVRFEGGYLAAPLSSSEEDSGLQVLHVRGADFPVELRLKNPKDGMPSQEKRALRVTANGQEQRLTPESRSIELHEPTERLKVGAATMPSEFALKKSRPNPVVRRATIEYAVAEKTEVTLEVYDVLGRRVARLLDETKRAGVYQRQIDAGRLRSGVYFVRMRAGDFQKTRRMTVVR